MLLGRDQERSALARLLDGLREARSGVLVVRGEAGIGKTALLDAAAELAGDMRVARVAGVESEMELGFAALHQLLVSFLGSVSELPVPQRDALGAAFGLSTGPPPDRFLVGLAALSLLTEAAVDQPVLCVVDDAQWVDRASLDALGFVARRLFADRVGMLFGVRNGTEEAIGLEGLPELRLAGLSEDAAGELLAASAPAPIDSSVRQRIAAATAGNPLAVVELGGELSADELAGAAPLPEPIRLADRLEELFLERVNALPAETQRLLLVAAADPSGDPALLWRAARSLGISRGAGDPPELARIVRLTPEVAFRHPLVRSAVYHGASDAVRRQTHRALAAACDPRLDADRRAWHLADAAGGPDEEVAAELERSAERASGRGGFVSSAAFLERAAQLTPDPAGRVRRSLAAAEAKVMAGDPAAAAALLRRATPHLEDETSKAHAKRLEGSIHAAAGNVAAAAETMLDAAAMLSPLDPRLARDTLLDAFNAAVLADRFANDWDAAAVLRVVGAGAAPAPSPQTTGDLLLDGFATIQDAGDEAGVPRLRAALDLLTGEPPQSGEVLRSLLLGTVAAVALLDDRALHTVTSRLVAEARRRGALTVLPTALARYGFFEVLAGRFAAGDRAIAEAREIAAATGAPDAMGRYPLAEVTSLAWKGDAAQTRDRARAFIAYSTGIGHGMAIRLVQLALTVLELALGDYRQALHAARYASEHGSPMRTLAMPELIEAAIRCEERAVASSMLDAFARRAQASGTDWALGMLARSQALLCQDEDRAEALYRRSIEHLEQCRIIPQLGRAHLLYGEWLRRRNRRRDARVELRSAHEILDSIGAEAFAERARVDLRATGEQARKRTVETRDQLTPQEQHIARLASEGASNQEIASQLFISSNTVAYHLQKVFRKLGVTRRTALARALIVHEPGGAAALPI